MEWMENSFIFLLGLIFGSFANVCIARIPSGKSIIKPGSQCPSCMTPISFYDNLPLLSWILLRGKCRNCKSPISPRYPVVEVLVGTLFLAAKIRFGLSWLLVFRDWPLLFSFVVISFIDLKHRIIPDVFSIGGCLLAIATSWLPGGPGLFAAVGGAVAGFSLFYFFAWLYEKMSGRSGLGGGDIKFLALAGAFLGVRGIFSTVLVSSVLGSVIGLSWGFFSGRKNRVMKTAIPYGPFLVLGALVEYFFGEALWFQYLNRM